MKHAMLNQIKIVAILLLAFVGCTEKETQVEVSSVSLNTATIEMVEGETFSLVATVLPKDAEYDKVIWASSNASVARVNSGTVTAIKEGITTITASTGGKSATCSVKVSTRVVAVTSITLDKTSLSMKVGETETITATVNPDNATDKTVTWGSSDVSVATVADGIVTAKSPGTVTVTAKSGIYTTDCDVTVLSDNVIIYTTTDKKVLTPYNEDAFGSAIVSNTYVGDVGIITFERPVTFIGNMAFNEQSKLKSIVIPSTVSTIGKRSFYECTGLLSVKLPQSLTSISGSAFYSCSSMKAFTFPDNVLEIGECAFVSCYKAFENNTLVLPKKLQTISSYAFYGCKLRSVIWNEDLNDIGTLAFCSNNFEEISIPGSVASSGFRSFNFCMLLKKVELQEGVTIVGDRCFERCEKLSKVILPSTLTQLNDPFSECYLLKDVYVKAIVPPVLDPYAFRDADLNLLSIWVPRESVDAYKKSGWIRYKDNIKAYDY